MAEWQSLNVPELPPELGQAISTARDGIQQVQDALELLREPLNVVLTFLREDVNPALTLLQQLLEETRKVLQDLADSSVFWITLHPWTGDLGTVGEINPYLLEMSSNAWLTYMSASFNDIGDLNRPTGSGSMYVLAGGATHPEGFMNALQAIGTLLNIQEFLSLANRVQSVSRINTEDRPPPAIPSQPPDWSNAGRLHSLIPPLGSLVSSADAVLESFMTSTSPIKSGMEELIKMLNRKLKQLDKAQAALEALQQSLSQDFADVVLLEVHGNLQSEFNAATGFPSNWRYTAGAAVASTTADLTAIKTLLKGL